MWCGIAAIVLAGLTVIENYGLVCFYGFFVWVFIVALVTGGLIYSFKDGSGRKMKNAIQDIRGNILRKKQSRMRNDDYDKDKHLIHSKNQIPKKTPAMRREGREEKAGVLGKSNYSHPADVVKTIIS
jgi:hypothetical protein